LSSPSPRGSVGEVFAAALRLGLTSFGGPIAHIGYFRREYVERRRWLGDDEFGEYVALAQSLPGPASSQLGIAIGTARAGMAGGLAAWLGFTLPSAAMLTLFAFAAASADVASAGWVHGLKLAAVAVVARAVHALAGSLAPDWPRKVLAVAGAALALLWTDPIAQVATIAGGAVVGWLVLAAPEPRPEARASSIAIPRAVGAIALVVFGVLLALVPFATAPAAPGSVAMTAAMYRAGALVFGGGHVVLPLLNQGVVAPGWVPESQFLAGYGAAQAVPGPLFSFAAYLGTVATPLGGVGGAAVALCAIYVPSFLLLFGVLPFWSRLRGSTSFRRALIGVNAAVVGLLAAALYTPVWTGAVGSVIDVAVVGLAVAALVFGRLPPIVVVAGCALVGQLIGG
jgi:chromate transporter